MKIFKFGGASVKTAEAVKNVKSIIDTYPVDQLFVVVSAMGKTTNALEKIAEALYQKDFSHFLEITNQLKAFHLKIAQDLFTDHAHPIFEEINTLFIQLEKRKEKRLAENYNFLYDQVVPLGEILSTKIVQAYLSLMEKDTEWIDARTLIRTDNHYRNADVDWKKTESMIQSVIKNSTARIFVTQGFVGHTDEGFSTTLGREGSDFTAGIIAYCTNAENVTIWKNVPGMLNADPKWFDDTVKLDKISYKEIIELAYYGASVVHPKTIKPLQNKNIPLYIQSFINPTSTGTIVQKETDCDALTPSFIFKTNQVLLSITPKDFSFIVEENLSAIFNKIACVGGHINLMQTSAVSFTVSLDIDTICLGQLKEMLDEDYITRYNDDLELVTIRYYDNATIQRVTQGKEVLMEQKTRHTVRIVMRKK